MKILVPMDMSSVSMNAFDYAIKKYPGASITALHVITSIMEVDYPLHHASNVNKRHRCIFDSHSHALPSCYKEKLTY